MTDFFIKKIEYGAGDEYLQMLALRQDVLRTPLGLKLSSEDLEQERNDDHIALFVNDKIAACLILVRLDDRNFQLRQMAVANDMQGHGLGKIVVQWAEDFVRSLAGAYIELEARESAVGFYNKIGYKKLSDRIERVGITHFKMGKDL